jgi:hypothetical protein
MSNWPLAISSAYSAGGRAVIDEATLAYWSAWAGMVSLVLTFVNTYLILRVKAGIVVNLTLEPMLNRLSENSANLNECLFDFDPNAQRFSEVAGVCEANAKAIRRRLGYVRSLFLRDFLRALRRFKARRSRENAQEVYAYLQQVRQHIANMIEEKRITG